MNPREFVLGMTLIMSATTLTLIGMWLRSRRRLPSSETSSQLQALESRLADLQNSIDSVAVEVERISEGQRFTTKLLSEKGSGIPVRSD